MNDSPQKSPTTWLATPIVAFGCLLLFVELLRTRALRITDTDTSFLTVEFFGLLAAALVYSAILLFLLRWGRIWRVLEPLAPARKWGILAVTAVTGFLGAAVLTGLFEFLQPYSVPFLLASIFALLAMGVRLLYSGNQIDPQTPSSPSNLQINLRPILNVALALIVPIVFLEFGMRFWFSLRGTQAEKIAYVYSWDEIAEQLRFRGVPYLNYGLAPTYPGVNSLGYRNAEIAIPKPNGVFRIVTLGGSTTYGELIDDPQQAYPAQLQQILREEYGYSQIEVINGGVPAYTSWHSLVNFQFRVLDLQPDLVIVYDGINELGSRAVPPASYAGIPPNAGTWRTDVPNLGISTLYRYIAINAGWIEDPRLITYRFQQFDPTLSCCENLTDEELAARFTANPPIYFERNLRNLAALAELHGIAVVFSSWTYYPDETVNNFNLMVKSYRQVAIAEQNAVLAAISADTSAEFFDLHAVLPYNPDYWFADGIHLTPLGTTEQARLYAGFLVEAGLLPSP